MKKDRKPLLLFLPTPVYHQVKENAALQNMSMTLYILQSVITRLETEPPTKRKNEKENYQKGKDHSAGNWIHSPPKKE